MKESIISNLLTAMKKNESAQENHFSISTFIIFICFIFSGMSGLIFEVAWSKALSLYLGNTLYAISTVVGAYMAGLGIGAIIAGRFSGQVRYPIRTYGWIEGIVGLFGLASPFLFKLLPPIFSNLFFLQDSSFPAFLMVRFFIIFFILLIPTIAMGMTLPILVSALTSRQPKFGSNVGKLYGLNTAGAVIGTLCGGFILLPHFGLFKTVISASLLNLTILALVYFVPILRNWQVDRKGQSTTETQGRTMWTGIPILLLFAMSGFLAMVYEVGWTRVLSLIIGSSVYSFTIILATFLLGIALGSLVIAKFAERMKRPLLAFGVLEVLLGITALAGTFLFYYLPQIFAAIIHKSNFNIRLIVPGEFFISGLISFIPCFIMGLLFPVAACAYKKSEASPGKNIGMIYFFNTFGAIFGSIITGFVLIPHIGILKALILTSGASVIIGIIAFFLSEIKLRPKVLSAGLALSFTLFLSVLVPPWNINRMNRGLIQIIRDIKSGDPSGGLKKEGQILYYKEGKNSTVAVTYTGNDMYLKIGGKIDASAVADAITQIFLGQLPMLYAKDPKDVCVIGLGSGVTTHSVLLHPVRSVDTIEIEDAVVEASKYFYPVNHAPLSDPRSRIIVDDARSYLSYTHKKYDVIISEPSNPWIAGINNLFTAQFYEIVNKKLKDGGVFCQWLQTYELSASSLATIIRTMNAQFPNCHFFYIPKGGDSLLIAKKNTIAFTYEDLLALFKNEAVRKDLLRIKVENPFDIIAYYIAPLSEMTRSLPQAEINTDDNSFIEYRAPIELLSPKERDYSIAVGNAFMDESRKVFLPDIEERKALVGLGLSCLHMNDKVRTDFILARMKNKNYEPETSQFIDEMRKMDEEKAQEVKGYETFDRADEALRNGNNDLAAQLAIKALTLGNSRDDLLFNCSLLLLNLGKNSEAEKILFDLIARETFAFTYTAYLNLGSLYCNQKQIDKGIEYYQKAIAYNPYLAGAYIQLAQAYMVIGEKEKARVNVQRALALEPSNAQALELHKSL